MVRCRKLSGQRMIVRLISVSIIDLIAILVNYTGGSHTESRNTLEATRKLLGHPTGETI